MSEPHSAASSAAVAAVGAVATAQVPDHLVMMGALLGALVSVWISRQHDHEPWSGMTIARVAGHLGVSAASGIVISIMIVSTLPHYAWGLPLVHIPQWTIAASVAALIHVVAPIAYSWLAKRSGKEQSK